MADTVVQQTRNAVFVDGVPMFRILANCTVQGDLPDTGLFVYEIVDTLDAQQDVFVRVAEIADLSPTDGFLSDRTSAVMAGAQYWRSYSLTKYYDSIDVADAAVTALFDRINALTNDYNAYTASFVVSNEDTSFPTDDPSYVAELKTTYDTSLDEYNTALAARDTAETALTTAQATYATEVTSLAEWQTMLASTQARYTEIVAAHTGLVNFIDAGTGNAQSTIAYIDGFITTYFTRYGVQTIKITFSSVALEPITADLGKQVKQDSPSLHTGTLVAYDATHWWVTPDDAGDTFNTTTDPVRIPAPGSTANGVPLSAAIIGSGPMDAEVINLQAVNNAFASATATAQIAADAAATSITAHGNDITFVEGRVTAHQSTVTTAQTDVTNKQTDYDQALGAVDAAYAVLSDAYDAVKAVDPSWVPDPPFPPTP